MAKCSQEKKLLVEELGIFFQEHHTFPPLAARLYALVVLSSSEGFTFEELMEITQSSKSSVSTSLNLLVSLKFVEYYTKTGNRKRYFKSTGSYMKKMLNKHMTSINNELAIVEKINAFHEKNNPLKFEQNDDACIAFNSYLISAKQELEETIEKLNAFNGN